MLPVPEMDSMCPMVAAAVLNRKGYGFPIPQANCRFGAFQLMIDSTLMQKGLRLNMYEGGNLAIGKIKLVKKASDGVLLMQGRSDGIFHFIAFIVVNNQLRFYDPENGKMYVYRLKNNASATDFNEDFIELFPDYNIVQVALIEAIRGGKRRRKTRRKTRKQRR